MEIRFRASQFCHLGRWISQKPPEVDAMSMLKDQHVSIDRIFTVVVNADDSAVVDLRERTRLAFDESGRSAFLVAGVDLENDALAVKVRVDCSENRASLSSTRQVLDN